MPLMRFSTTNVVFSQLFAAKAFRKRCVPFASPPPPAIISSIGIVVSANAPSSSATAVADDAEKCQAVHGRQPQVGEHQVRAIDHFERLFGGGGFVDVRSEEHTSELQS